MTEFVKSIQTLPQAIVAIAVVAAVAAVIITLIRRV
jgi:hypothetical protein